MPDLGITLGTGMSKRNRYPFSKPLSACLILLLLWILMSLDAVVPYRSHLLFFKGPGADGWLDDVL